MTVYRSNPATTGLGYGMGSPAATPQSALANMAAQYTLTTTSTGNTVPVSIEQVAALGQQQALQRAQLEQQFLQAAIQGAQQQQYAQVPAGGMIPVTVASTGDGFIITSTASVTGFSQFGDASAPTATQPSTDSYYRSMDLLYEWLTPEQRKQLAIRRSFDVIGGDTGNRYRLHPPCPYNIHQLCRGSDEIECKLCFVPKDPRLPSGDIWLCQKLALELDERATLEIANRQTYHGF